MPTRSPPRGTPVLPGLFQTSVHPGEWRSASLPLGSILEGFRIDRQIGRGGMGTVYAAWELAHDRPAAVKILGGAIGSSKHFARFLREAETTARLKHPGIVELYQIGQTSELCYLAMQLVDGITLRDWIGRVPRMTMHELTNRAGVAEDEPAEIPAVRSVRLNRTDSAFEDTDADSDEESTPRAVPLLARRHYVRRVAEMLRGAADALAHAHAVGVTHRDLKPDNVMVRPDGSVVIIDFGLARSFADATITSHSALVGTPMYMSPEQLQGKVAGPESDIYAVGLIGYELLSLTVPFRAHSIEGLLREVLHKPIPPLVGRNPAVPAELANIVHRAMSRSTADRYTTAAELRDDLDRHLAGGRVTAAGYRYRFDCRDVIAERPRRVVVAGLLNLGIGGLLALTALATLAKGAISGLEIAALAMLYCVSGWRFYSGRSGAVAAGWSAVLGAVVSCGLIGREATAKDGLAWFSTLFLMLMFAFVGGVTAVALRSVRTRRWLELIREKRREFEAERRGKRE